MTQLTEHAPHHCTEIDGLRVVTLGHHDASRQILLFMGFLACVDRFELQRFDLLCREWDAQITVVDTPGWGYGGARLTRDERRALRRGDFTAVARRMVHAAQQHHAPLRHAPLTVAGYSMGASLACAAAADPGLLRVESMILVEPVAMRRWNLARLVCSVRSEGRVIEDFLDKNNAVPGAVMPDTHPGKSSPSQSRTDLAHLGYALSRGRLMSDLLRINMIQSFPVQIVHGVDSLLSRGHDITKLVAICRRAGMSILDVPVEGRHALWHSLPDVAALARRTRSQWNG